VPPKWLPLPGPEGIPLNIIAIGGGIAVLERGQSVRAA
jgi:hypothetical protein